MSIIDTLISNIAPHDCLGCGYEGRLICVQCAGNFEKIPERCYCCRRPSPFWRTCQACRDTSKLSAVWAATVYDGAAKDLVWYLKFHGAQEAARIMAAYMADALPEANRGCFVPVPTATKRARRRGYDQAKLLARQLAKHSRLPYQDCLRRSGQTHQVGASRQERLQQLQAAFRVGTGQDALIKDRSVVLVDDVVTTGATLEAAAAALQQAGATNVRAIVFAQPNTSNNKI
jgi:ComF family protein